MEKLQKDLDFYNEQDADNIMVVNSLLEISKILSMIDNYADSLENMVKFAVDHSGAERGVLLLKGEHTDKMLVGAYVNVDPDSLTDIKNFSLTIPHQVTADGTPLIIENALKDKRTKTYKSVIYHNIHSVVCIPITYNQEDLGVLYLDHHSIPALFEDKDISFIMSIANFIGVALKTSKEHRRTAILNRELKSELSNLGYKNRLITTDKKMLDILDKLYQIARTNAPVLITGETGTGKDILCNLIHEQSNRAKNALVKVNCAAFSSTMVESELFGVAPNVATGVAERDGKFSAADGSTLFLDEIGNMPMELQKKVLTAVEYQEFEKVGSNRTIKTDIRFVYATNKNLKKMVEEGEFAHDLYHRINTISIEIPALRNRKNDINLLLDYFISVFSTGKKPPEFPLNTLEHLINYKWPGNVRELRNLAEKYCVLYPGQRITPDLLPVEIIESNKGMNNKKESLEAHEALSIKKALQENNWVQSKAAESIGMPLTTFRRKMKKYRINKDR